MAQQEWVGIPYARDATGRTFDRTDIGRPVRPFVKPLRCGGCSAPVAAVSQSTRRRGNTIVHVAPYYRLINRTENDHDPSCKYNFDARIGEIVIEHRSEITRDGDVYVLTLRKPTPPRRPNETPDFDLDGGRKTRLVVKPVSDHSLNPTIQTAAKIARLLRDFDNAPDAKARFKAGYGGEVVDWDNFFFDAEQDPDRLASRISSRNNDLHPIAVVGRVAHVAPFQNGSGRTVTLGAPSEGLASGRRRVRVVLRSADPDLLYYETQDVVIGYGTWQLWSPSPESERVDVRLWCDTSSATSRVQS